MIFDYVTNYCLKHETIPTVQDFEFTAFDDFVKYVLDQGFDYETGSEKLLNKLMANAKDEDYYDIIGSEIEAIEAKIKQEKKNDLQTHKEDIVDMIEKEIVSRYYYQKGKIQIGLKNDQEVAEAIKMINDEAAYKSILKQ